MNSTRQEEFDRAYMAFAVALAALSYCKKRKVGAVLVSGNTVIGYGFNGAVSGMPNVCEDDDEATEHTSDVHAEENALLKSMPAERSGSTMYVTTYPCLRCTRLMAQAGVRRVVYMEDKDVNGRVEHYGMESVKLEGPWTT